MVDIKQIEELKKTFDDLGISIEDVSKSNEDLFKSIEEHLDSIVKSVTETVTEDYLKSIKTSTAVAFNNQEEVNNIIGDLQDKFGGLKYLEEVAEKLERKIEGISGSFDKLVKKRSRKRGEKDKSKSSTLKEAGTSTVKTIKGSINKMGSKDGLSLGDGLLGGLVGLMIYGVKDKFRVKAEAGEIENILVAATGNTTKKIINDATSKLSGLQERLSRFYGINRKEVQGVIQSFVDGGIKIQEMLKAFPKDIKEVEDNFTTALLAIDKFLEVPGGWSAKKTVQYMADYGKSFEDSVKSVSKLVIAGKESGIGIHQFIKNIESTREGLVKYGFDIDDVVDLSLSLQKNFEEMGVPKQFAGRQAALGMQQIASSFTGMSDEWKVLIAKKMGFGGGLEGRQKLMESWTRVAKGGDDDKLQNFIKAMGEIALEVSEGEESKARYVLEKSMGLGFEGANAVVEITKLIQAGKLESASSLVAKNKNLFKDAITTEKEKANELLLHVNEFLKGMAKIGQAILGMIMDSLAMLVTYFKIAPKLFYNWMLDTKESREDNAKLIAETNAIFNDEYKALAMEGVREVISATKKMGEDILGKSLEALLKALGIESDDDNTRNYRIVKKPSLSNKPSNTSFVMVPNTDFAGNTELAPQTPSQPRSLTNEDRMYNDSYGMSSEDYSGGITIVADDVDENGDIHMHLEGNCPSCGVEFKNDSSMEGVSEDEEVDVVGKGFLGGRFRRQSLRPGAKAGRAHAGIDINAPEGSPIHIPESGKIIHIGDARGAGKNIQVMHPGGETSWLMHLKDVAEGLKIGSEVSRGQRIGEVGSTTGGKSPTSPHIHYEVLKPGVSTEDKVRKPASHDQGKFDLRVDPLEFFKQSGASPFSHHLSKEDYNKRG